MRRTFGVVAIAVLSLTVACAQEEGGGATSGPRIVVGSANFTESKILAEIYAQGLEAKDYSVSKKLNLGAREVYFPALQNGSIGLFPEYTGSTLSYLTKDPDASKPDPQQNYDNLVRELKRKNLTALEMAAAQDQDGIVVNKVTAEEYNLEKVSDLKPHASELVMGGPPECPKRQACLKGLEEVYDIHFKEFKPLDVAGPQTVEALKANEIQVANLFTTQPVIPANGFVLLEQDKPIVGAENVVPVVRDEIAEAYGEEFADAVNAITAKLTTEGLTDLNKQVDIDHRDPDDVAGAWLRDNGFI